MTPDSAKIERAILNCLALSGGLMCCVSTHKGSLIDGQVRAGILHATYTHITAVPSACTDFVLRCV